MPLDVYGTLSSPRQAGINEKLEAAGVRSWELPTGHRAVRRLD